MGKRIFVAVFLAGMLAACQSRPSQTSGNDETPLRKIPQEFVDGWNARDAASLGGLMADDVDFVEVGAVWLHGRSDFAAFHQRMMTGRLRDTQMKLLGTRVIFVTPDIAEVHWAWEMQGDRDTDNTLRPPRRGLMLMVVKRGPSGWLVQSAQNTSAVFPAPPELDGITPAFWFPDE